MPPKEDEEALWRVIRDAMTEQGVSVRALAKAFDPDKIEPQRRKINKWLNPKKPTIPSAKEARKLAAELGKPADYFVRPRPRKVDQTTQALLERAEQAETELAAYRERYGPL